MTGANSSVGRNLLAHVARGDDFEVVACVRSQSAAATLPQSPRIQPRIVSYDDASALADAADGVTHVVHLAGILLESRSTDYASANVGATRAVIEAAKSGGAKHIVFTSVLGADTDSSNAFLRSKGEAERAISDSGLRSTIIRTPILLGPGTAGASSMVRTASQPKARLLGGGTYVLRPLDIDDLSRAMLGACRSAGEGVSVHELVGPEAISHRDLIERIAGMLGRDVHISAAPIWLAKLGAAVTSRVRGGGMTPTVIDVITSSEHVERNADADLGVSLTPLADTLSRILSNEKRDE